MAPGDRMIWRRWTSAGHGYLEKVPCTVVRQNARTVTIDAELARGGTKRIRVRPESLAASPGGEPGKEGA